MELQYLAFLNDYKDILGHTEGITPLDLEKIEKEYEIKLPLSYKEYLLTFGKDCGQLMPSYLMTINNLKRNADCVKFDLEHTVHNNLFKIRKEMLFFGQWQGTIFYFLCDCNDNPPIYFIQDFDDIVKYKDSFSDFIRDEGLKPLLEIYNNK